MYAKRRGAPEQVSDVVALADIVNDEVAFRMPCSCNTGRAELICCARYSVEGWQQAFRFSLHLVESHDDRQIVAGE